MLLLRRGSRICKDLLTTLPSRPELSWISRRLNLRLPLHQGRLLTSISEMAILRLPSARPQQSKNSTLSTSTTRCSKHTRRLHPNRNVHYARNPYPDYSWRNSLVRVISVYGSKPDFVQHTRDDRRKKYGEKKVTPVLSGKSSRRGYQSTEML